MNTPTEEQQTAIVSEARRLAIIACPGSGKSSTLVERVVRFIRAGIGTERSINVVTFTVAAAKEFREKLEARGIDTNLLGYVGTIHGHALRTIRDLTPGDSNVSVISRELGDNLIQEIIDTNGLKTTTTKVLGALGSFKERTDHEIGAAIYRGKLKAIGGIEIDMIIPVAEIMLSNTAEREPVNLFVDEFQDTSRGDWRYLEQVIGSFNPEGTGMERHMTDGSTITVVGDPSQAIYRFRGARTENFYEFMQTAGETVGLRKSFRLPAKIAQKAATLMKTTVDPVNPDIEGKVLVRPTENPESELVMLREILARYCQDLEDRPCYGPGDIAILCRYNRGVTAARAVCVAAGYPVHEPAGSIDPNRAKALAFADLVAKHSPLALMEWEFRTGKPALDDASVYDGMISDRNTLYAGMIEARVDPDAARWFLGVLDNAGGNLDRAIFDARISSKKEPDPTMGEGSGGGKLTITTMHKAKGLEFPVVIMLGCEEMTIPGLNASPERIEEERRIFYVALTRAQHTVILSHASQRTEFHSTDLLGTVPSRFMRESEII